MDKLEGFFLGLGSLSLSLGGLLSLISLGWFDGFCLACRRLRGPELSWAPLVLGLIFSLAGRAGSVGVCSVCSRPSASESGFLGASLGFAIFWAGF